MSEAFPGFEFDGPMDRMERICSQATTFDETIRNDESANQEAAKQLVFAMEQDNPILGKKVEAFGEIATPLIDESGDDQGLVFSHQIGRVEGVYRGLNVFPFQHIESDGDLSKQLRVVHYLQTGTETYYDQYGSRFTKDSHAFIAVPDAEIMPTGFTEVHSLAYLNCEDNVAAADLAARIDGIANSDESAGQKVEQLVELLEANLSDINADTLLRRNIISYVNSLGFFSEISLAAELIVCDDQGELCVYKLKECGFEPGSVTGLSLFNRVDVDVDAEEILVGEDMALYFTMQSEKYGHVLTLAQSTHTLYGDA